MAEFRGVHPTRHKHHARAIEVALWISLAVLTVLLPNAFKLVTAALLGLAAAHYVLVKQTFMSGRLAKIWFIIAFVTIFYVLVGAVNGAPNEALGQVVIVYIISPLLWIVALRGALLTFGLERIIRFLTLLTVFAILSQIFYYWAFPAGRFPQLLELMAGTPNLDYSNNQVGAVMFVFGSMIFLYAGLFAAPEVVTNKSLRLILMLAAFISAFTSGRSALILGVFIGLFINVVTSLRFSGRLVRLFAVNIPMLAIAGLVGAYALFTLFDIDVSVPITLLVEKISSSGGAGRAIYLPLLFEGAADHLFLGAGHGIGVDYAVSADFPWRYEVVGAATLFRVGIVGFLLYSLPFIIALREAFRAHRMHGLSRDEKYLVGTLIAGVMAANTNPYIEAVVFQWMFVLPCTYFIDRKFLMQYR